MFSTPAPTRCSSRAVVVVGGWRAPIFAAVAQLVERRFCSPDAWGSIPHGGANVPSLRHSGDVHPASTAGAFYSSGAAHSKSPHIRSMKFIASSACSMQWAISLSSVAAAHVLMSFGVSMGMHCADGHTKRHSVLIHVNSQPFNLLQESSK